MTLRTPPSADADVLRRKVIRSLRAQGFRVHKGTILPPKDLSKDKLRELHKTAVEHRDMIGSRMVKAE